MQENKGDFICITMGPASKKDITHYNKKTPVKAWDMQTDFTVKLDEKNSRDRKHLEAMGDTSSMVNRDKIRSGPVSKMNFFKVFARL